MYSKNDYRYYLEHQLMMSDDYLAHYGVLGMRWGYRHDNRVASLSSKRAANSQKIASYQKKLNTVGAKKRAEKAAKYQAKLDKYERKAAKARKRLAQGKNISTAQLKKIQKAESYKAKVAKNSAKNDKYQAKIAKLERKNTRIDKKISKLEKPSMSGALAYQMGLNSLDAKKIRSDYKRDHGLTEKTRAKAKLKSSDLSKEQSSTIKDAQKRGYEVSTRDTYRWANPVESTALAAVTAALPTPVAYTNMSQYPGTQYTVKKPKENKKK